MNLDMKYIPEEGLVLFFDELTEVLRVRFCGFLESQSMINLNRGRKELLREGNVIKERDHEVAFLDEITIHPEYKGKGLEYIYLPKAIEYIRDITYTNTVYVDVCNISEELNDAAKLRESLHESILMYYKLGFICVLDTYNFYAPLNRTILMKFNIKVRYKSEKVFEYLLSKDVYGLSVEDKLKYGINFKEDNILSGSLDENIQRYKEDNHPDFND